MTNEQLLEKFYPRQMARIRALTSERFLAKEPTTNAPNTLASAFDWYTTEEGWEFWNDLYQFGPRVMADSHQ